MIVSEIRYNQVIERLRFDADYFLPEYLKVDNLLNRINCVKFEKIIKSINAGKNLPQCDESYKYDKVPFIRTQNIRQILIDKTGLSYVISEKLKDVSLKKLGQGDLLVVRVGVGISDNVVVFDEFVGAAYSDNTIRIEINKDKVNPFYLSVYLNSKYGRKYWERVQKGSARPLISYENIFEVIIPIPPYPFQKKIESLVKSAYEKRKLADEKYKQAQELLNKILGIEKLELKEEKVFEARFGEIEQTLRFDAEHYQPKYKRAREFIIKLGYEVKKLKEVVTISSKKINPSDEPTKSFSYIELANVNSSTGEIEEVSQVQGHSAPSRARMLVKKDDVLVSSLLGSLDNVGLVPAELDGAVASTGFFVIRSKFFLPEFLFLLFKSNLMRLQLEERTAGAIMSAIPKTAFEDLLISIIPEEHQKQVSDLVRQSFLLRKESKELIEKAKKEIEEFIERGESETDKDPF